MLNIKDIDVFYGKVQVLWNVSFNIKKGETITILGSNGAGKTTTVKTILGLIHPSAGKIRFMDEYIENHKTYNIVNRGIALVPEGREIFPKMTVLENLMLGAYTSRAKKGCEKTLSGVFKMFPKLKDREKQLAGTLSGGEQQMMAIARALMSKPKLLMLDEPSLGLAPILVLKIFDVIKKLKEEGVTILLVEQNVHHALKVSDRGYVLEKGRLILEGSGKELLDNRYVKESYLGL